MNRRDSIRAAMQSLLFSERHEQLTGRPAPDLGSGGTLFEVAGRAQGRVLEEMQATLQEYGIKATFGELAVAILQAALARPELSRGLLAAYMLDQEKPEEPELAA